MTVRRRTLIGGAVAATYLPLISSMARAQQTRTMLLAATGTPEGFDGDALRPGTQNSVTQIYEGLVRYGRVERDGRWYQNPTAFEPHLAESWKTSEDGKTWIFTLRSGVKSAYGNEMTAADVEWGWQKSFAQKRTGAFIAAVANVTGVKALSAREVEFTLSAPSSIFLACLTLYTPGIYDTTEVKKHVTPEDPWALKWMETHTAGFGAYHLDTVESGQQAVFVANPNYFRSAPYFGRVVYRAVPSGASRISLLRTGQVQWIDRPTVQQVIEMQKDQRVKVQDVEGRAMASIRMNCAMKPFDDVRVRRAFNHAIDRTKLKQAIFLGTGTEAVSILPLNFPAYDGSFFNLGYDPAKARALLAEAGIPDGFEVQLAFSDIAWWEEQMAVQIADQLRQVGVNAKPQRITASDARARSAPGRQDLPFFTFEDGPIVLDSVYSMSLLTKSDGVANRERYSNKQLDDLIVKARTSMDPVVRDAAMREAQQVWMNDAPWIMTLYPTIFEAMAPNISGWVPHADDHERWVDLKAG